MEEIINEENDDVTECPKFRKENIKFIDPVQNENIKNARNSKIRTQYVIEEYVLKKKYRDISPSLDERGAHTFQEKKRGSTREQLTKSEFSKIQEHIPLKIERRKFGQPVIRLPSPTNVGVIDIIRVPSPDVLQAKIVPRKPSNLITTEWPLPPTEEELELKKPKSGIMININDNASILTDNTSLGYDRPYTKNIFIHDEAQVSSNTEEIVVKSEAEVEAMSSKPSSEVKFSDNVPVPESDECDEEVMQIDNPNTVDNASTMENASIVENSNIAENIDKNSAPLEDTKSAKSSVKSAKGSEKSAKGSEKSAKGSEKSKDKSVSKTSKNKYEEDKENVDNNMPKKNKEKHKPYIQEGDASSIKTEMTSRWVQKFRRDSETQKYELAPLIITRGTLESHSATDLKEPKVFPFRYGIRLGGGYHQADKHFSEKSRNKQGIANAIVSFCYSFIKHPIMWTPQNIDDILEEGNKLYLDTLDNLHKHYDNPILKAIDYNQSVLIEKHKFFYSVSEPLIIGITRSQDATIFNLWKGLKMFFDRYNCGLFQTIDIEIAIWKNKFFYLFDPTPCTKELKKHSKGSAAIISFFDVECVASYFLDYVNIGNWSYMISLINAYESADTATKLNIFGTRLGIEYHVLSETKAIINGNFNLCDKCFDVTADKQALPMCVIALCYTRITPPAAWSQGTVDKILILGNQFFLECNINSSPEEIHLPALFTIGPYRTEICIVLNVIWGSLLAEKRPKNLELGLCEFFEKSHMALLQYDKYTYAIWTQGNYFYLFDVYSRDNTGHECENGTSCVSIYSSLENLQETLLGNIEKSTDSSFSLHALKVVKMSHGVIEKELKPVDTETVLNSNKVREKRTKSIDVDMTTNAVTKLQKYEEPNESVMEIESDIISLGCEYVPELRPPGKDSDIKHKKGLKLSPLIIYDLDSPSLMKLLEEDEIEGEPEEGWDEMEFFTTGEGEDALMEELELKLLEELEKDFLSEIEKKKQDELEKETTQTGTNTPAIKHLPKRILPTLKVERVKEKDEFTVEELLDTELIPEVTTLSQELLIDTNFFDLPDGTQIIVSPKNIEKYDAQPIVLSPFVVTMAIVISYKYTINSWSDAVINYVLDAGYELCKNSPIKFQDAAVHEFLRISLGSTDFKVTVKYVLDSVLQQATMESVLEKTLFKKHDQGIIVNPNYACAVFKKSNLYYLYDPYPCRKIGIGSGKNTEGNACLMRFSSLHQLVSRLLYNKKKREADTEYETTRYILSVVKVTLIPQIVEEDKINDNITEDVSSKLEEEKVQDTDEETKIIQQKPKHTKVIGYVKMNDKYVIQGLKGLKNRSEFLDRFIKDCHFVCLCSLLMLMCCPIDKWCARRIDTVVECGLYISTQAFEKDICERRTVTNILLENHFFNVSIIKTEVCSFCVEDKTPSSGIASLLEKRRYIILQFPLCSYVMYFGNNKYHLFDPYGSQEPGRADWTRYKNYMEVIDRLKSDNEDNFEACIYYTVDVTSIHRVPKKQALSYYTSEYKLKPSTHKEKLGKQFHEREEWLKIDPIPWSRLEKKNPLGGYRGQLETMWNEWDIEYPNDLYSLWGTLHQKSKRFSNETRGKQTFANCVVALFMMYIYDFSQWNSILMDSILIYGNKYFSKSIMHLTQENYEIDITDLDKEIAVYPYKASVNFRPIVKGTLFLLRQKQFNLYKSLRYFFDNVNQRFGIIICTNGYRKRILMFGKFDVAEYCIYDCQSFGPPVFLNKQGCSFMLRMTSFNRLLYCLVLLLREGDFYIYELAISDIKEEKKVSIKI